VLSTAAYAADHPTLVLTRQEMMGWTQLQLEPTALRAPDPFHAPAQVGADGAHLPSALLAQARAAERAAPGGADDVYAALANRLAGLYEDVASLRVDVDERRELHTIVLTDLRGAEHRASALSDGTLRFLALAILEASPAGLPLICLEEPENGIHPDRIEVILGLLQDIAVDVHRPTGPDNPMRQVIINTHAPRSHSGSPKTAWSSPRPSSGCAARHGRAPSACRACRRPGGPPKVGRRSTRFWPTFSHRPNSAGGYGNSSLDRSLFPPRHGCPCARCR
jgi:hypothetical protein